MHNLRARKKRATSKVTFRTITSLWVAFDLSTLYFKLINFRIQWEGLHETWATEILVGGNYFFNLCKIIPLATGNHRHPFSVFFFFSEEGRGCTRAIPSSRVFFITPILFIPSKVNAPKQHFRWSQLTNRKNKKNYPYFSISKVQRNHRGTQRQFSENILS